MSRRRHSNTEAPQDDDVDLNPLIDVITMLIIFFILGGRMSSDIRAEQITVPPTKTAQKLDQERGWERIVVNVFGNTQVKRKVASMGVRVGNKEFRSEGVDDYTAYVGLRQLLDKSYDRADKVPDPKGTGLQLPMVVVEIRADADTQYRVVQELQQVICDTIDPSNAMTPKKVMRPFVNINFTTRQPGDR